MQKGVGVVRFPAREISAPLLARLLLLASLVVGVIVGLLTMHLPLASDGHPMSGSAMSASAVASSAMSAPTVADAAGADSLDPAVSCALGCAGSSSGSDEMTMLMMVCVVVLFGVAVALAGISAGWRLRLSDVLDRVSRAARVPHPRPPSLYALSISRT